MRVELAKWTDADGWELERGTLEGATGQDLVVVFGDAALISRPETYGRVLERYPGAEVIGCSTSGNILDDRVEDDCIVAHALRFERSRVRCVAMEVRDPKGSRAVGETLARKLAGAGLRHVFILSDGLHVNGSELAAGFNHACPEGVRMTGGLAGDGTAFKETWVVANGPARPRQVVAAGLYGEDLVVGYGCLHGWENFGVQRHVTRSEGNVVFEIDGEPALDLYRRYLGDEMARGLPATGLRFPLVVELAEGEEPVVRTLLAIDEEAKSLTFAGDVPARRVVMLMKTNLDGLIAAAKAAAEVARVEASGDGAALAVSCVGRRLVLSRQVEEEVEAVKEGIGEAFTLSGYYSYGELAPTGEHVHCQLHNQTMTLTTLSER
ncbi:MAG: FIST C-terminal domain-containing protein [Planctomycetes bacterium]|nr:FIST C-terminal domain-containing protein [Planctomycetota bacterium]